MKEFLKHLFSTITEMFVTRFVGVSIALGCALVFGFGIFMCAVLGADYSNVEEGLFIELAISGVIVAINAGYFFAVAKLWKKSKGVKAFYFSISPKVWLGLSVFSWLGGVASGFWLFN